MTARPVQGGGVPSPEGDLSRRRSRSGRGDAGASGRAATPSPERRSRSRRVASFWRESPAEVRAANCPSRECPTTPLSDPGTLDGPGGGPNRARMMMTLHPPDNVWEARLSLPQRPGGASRPLPLLDAQARSSPPCSVRAGARKDRRLEAHRRRTRPVPGVDREQPGTGTARERNAPHLFACACPHHRQAGSMNPRVSGSA